MIFPLKMAIRGDVPHRDSPQRCRLCIARCIARSSSIVLVDEATSCVDGETDALIQEASP